jgi:predicted Zn-dependent protease
MKRLKWTLLAAAVALVATTVAQAQLGGSTEKEVRRQARLQWMQVKRHVPIEPDERVQRYVQCVTDRIIAQLPAEQREAFEWEVVVFDDDEPNAQADPNGKIAVASGLFKVVDTQDALAAVIGHEVTHATEGHSLARMRRAARQEAWAMIGGAATGSGYMGAELRTYLHLSLGLPFSRENEIEADVIGLDVMAKAGFDPRAAINLWKGMTAYQQSQGREPARGLESTHPSDDVRIDNLVKVLAPALVEYNAAREAGRRPNCQANLAAARPATR